MQDYDKNDTRIFDPNPALFISRSFVNTFVTV